MTQIQVKNEAEFLTSIHSTKEVFFDKMCSSILSNYNIFSGKQIVYNSDYRYNNKTNQSPLLRLFDKLRHISFNLYSPQSILPFLTRIVTKPAKIISRPARSYDQPNENIYGLGHFRWDFMAYTLDELELKAIAVYLGLHIKEPVKEIINPTDYYTNKPNFEEITGYNDQAEAFLKWTGTDFKAEFKEHSTYFDDDKTARDIFIITLKNKKHKYKFTFGQSISNVGKMPTSYDILSCIEKYPVYDFEDFCSNYGYDTDSRKAYKTYKAVKKESENIHMLFNEQELELLREIQ